MTTAHAAVMTGIDELRMSELDLDEPQAGEVRVRLRTSGVCHSDLSFLDGSWPIPTPVVLGHEGFGTIEAVGPGVDPQRIGEEVVLTFVPGCGVCARCLEGRVNLCRAAAGFMDSGHLPDGTSRLRDAGGGVVHHLAAVSSFATHAVVPARGAITVPAGLDPAQACLLGCGVLTGVMSVVHRGAVRPGEAIAVFGCGGVGQSALLGARLVSAYPRIAVEPDPQRRELALQAGATHAIDPRDPGFVAALHSLAPDGIDAAFEASGRPEVAEQAIASVREGGRAVLIGQPALGVRAGLDLYTVTQFETDVLGTHIGGATPALHIPLLARLMQAGLLDVAPLVTHRFELDELPAAIAALHAGGTGRVVLDLA